MTPSYKLWATGKWVESEDRRQILSPFDKSVVAECHQATASQMESVISSSVEAFNVFKKSSRYTRSQLLFRIAAEIENVKEKFVEKMILEAGKPRAAAEVEVTRAVATFTIAAEEAKRMGGELVPLDSDANSQAFSPAVSMWVPRGPILAITPFNFPLNLAAHKVAPALAVGASVILKPPPQAPGCAHLLAEIFEKVSGETPKGALQVVNASNDVTSLAVTDPRLSVLSFTGSDRVGWMLQGQALKKKIVLELGGNAAAVIHKDADLSRAAQRCAAGGFGYAGQTCISVQRIFVHEEVYDAFCINLVAEVTKLKCGDPGDKAVTVGPLIDDGTASRVESWINSAKERGAKDLLDSKRSGNIITPAILTHVPKDCQVNCEEVFGPVVVLHKYRDFNDAMAGVNDSRFGLQVGVFTDSSKLIQQSFEELEVGGVVINEIPTFRADHMPYGGVKDSGLGREGLRYAMEDYCERRTLITWRGKK